MLISILAIYTASLLTSFFYNRYRTIIAAALTVILLCIILYFSLLLSPVIHGMTFNSSFSWIASLGINLSFYLDGLSIFFSLLITVIGLLVLLYSFRYMKENQQQGRFFTYFLLFMGSMLGLVLSANLISLFVFWELTSFSSFLLIGFNTADKESRRAARQALLVTAGGGLALMSGLILMGIITGSGFGLIDMLNNSESLANSGLLTAAIILIVIGAMTKSAQFPFHFWLPNAMAAPTPVSAYLHSATMVKAGVYLIFRLNPLFQDNVLWMYMLGIGGAITMSWGAIKALQEDDLKKILAYTTISALGIFFMMTGLGGQEAMNAVIVYVLAHALYKGGLFLIAGNIQHQTGSRKISQLSDLGLKMPYTALAAVLACASMAGIIPFIGFVGKESLYEVLLHSENKLALAYLALLFLAGAVFTVITIEIVYNIFFKKGDFRDKPVGEAGKLMVFAPLVLALSGLIIGLAPQIFAAPLLRWSAAEIYNGMPSMALKLWHGFNWVFALSLFTIFSGATLYFIPNRIRTFSKPKWTDADFIYDKLINGISSGSKSITGIVQYGYLRNYVAMIILTFCGMMIFMFISGDFTGYLTVENILSDVEIYEVVIIALITIAVIILFRTKSRLMVTATFGIIGYSIALAYTLFSAPDVAITQFLAETLTLMLLILILHRLPSYTLKKAIPYKRYFPVALLFGITMTLTSFILLNRKNDTHLKTYFLENSLSEGKGENAVNVILTDFRALDTLGEITVLTITMIGIIALLKIKRGK